MFNLTLNFEDHFQVLRHILSEWCRVYHRHLSVGEIDWRRHPGWWRNWQTLWSRRLVAFGASVQAAFGGRGERVPHRGHLLGASGRARKGVSTFSQSRSSLRARTGMRNRLHAALSWKKAFLWPGFGVGRGLLHLPTAIVAFWMLFDGRSSVRGCFAFGMRRNHFERLVS